LATCKRKHTACWHYTATCNVSNKTAHENAYLSAQLPSMCATFLTSNLDIYPHYQVYATRVLATKHKKGQNAYDVAHVPAVHQRVGQATPPSLCRVQQGGSSASWCAPLGARGCASVEGLRADWGGGTNERYCQVPPSRIDWVTSYERNSAWGFFLSKAGFRFPKAGYLEFGCFGL
jgi:hypothetical protein